MEFNHQDHGGNIKHYHLFEFRPINLLVSTLFGTLGILIAIKIWDLII